MTIRILLVMLFVYGNPSTRAPKPPYNPPQVDKESQPMNENGSRGVVAVSYEFHDLRGGGQRVEIVSAGESSLSVTLGADIERPEIGVWSYAVPEARFQALIQRLHAAGWQSLPQTPGLGGGITFSERRAGEPHATLRGCGLEPEKEHVLLGLFGDIVDELRRHPARVIRGEARWRNAVLKRGTDLEFDVTLTNIGTLPLRFANPFHGSESQWNGLRLVVGPQAPGSSEQSFDLKPKDMLARKTAPTAAKLALAPGQRVSFAARRKLSVPPGRYETRLQVYNMGPGTEEPDPELVPGSLWLYPGPITVTP